VGDILTHKAYSSLLDLITLEAHDGHEETGFAGAVLPEENMGFPDRDLNIDPLEHFLVFNIHPEVVDFKHKNLTSITRKPPK
jgi:hypothetical protein